MRENRVGVELQKQSTIEKRRVSRSPTNKEQQRRCAEKDERRVSERELWE